MGSPEIYYKRTLQAFAYNLNYATNKERAELLYEEESVNILEEEIMRWKDSLGEKEFYYQAGRTTEYVLNIADKNDGCDGFNACLGGIYNFENFIGITNGEEINMRNIDRIRRMSLEELAPLLVHSTEEDVGDYDWEENPILYYVTIWHSPSGNCFQDYGGKGREEAIEDCIEWLDTEYIDDNIQVYCTDCESLCINDDIPSCEWEHDCSLLDCEDSRPFRERKHYRQRDETNLSCV